GFSIPASKDRSPGTPGFSTPASKGRSPGTPGFSTPASTGRSPGTPGFPPNCDIDSVLSTAATPPPGGYIPKALFIKWLGLVLVHFLCFPLRQEEKPTASRGFFFTCTNTIRADSGNSSAFVISFGLREISHF